MWKFKVWHEKHIRLDYLSDRIADLVNERNGVNVIYLGFSKAFDAVS